MDAIERSIIGPQIEIAIDRALGRQILRDRAPLATGREHIHQAVHDIANVDPALPTARLAGGINGSTCAHSSSVTSLG